MVLPLYRYRCLCHCCHWRCRQPSHAHIRKTMRNTPCSKKSINWYYNSNNALETIVTKTKIQCKPCFQLPCLFSFTFYRSLIGIFWKRKKDTTTANIHSVRSPVCRCSDFSCSISSLQCTPYMWHSVVTISYRLVQSMFEYVCMLDTVKTSFRALSIRWTETNLTFDMLSFYQAFIVHMGNMDHFYWNSV